MTLVAAAISPHKANTGRLKYIAGDPLSSLSGIIEAKPGWLLCNGVVIPSSGRYQPLYVMLAGRFGGAGKLPTIIDGITPIPKGASSFPTSGAAGGEISHAITVAEYPVHQHYGQDNIGNAGNGLLNVDGWPNRSQTDGWKWTSVFGGGAAHQNMPPYLVGGYMLVKL